MTAKSVVTQHVLWVVPLRHKIHLKSATRIYLLFELITQTVHVWSNVLAMLFSWSIRFTQLGEIENRGWVCSITCCLPQIHAVSTMFCIDF